MTKESSLLRIIKEDILRVLSERRKVSLNIIKQEIKVSFSFISEAIEELEKEGLIHSRQDFFELTEKGTGKAKDILRKHLVFENYFKRTKSENEAHEIANVLEHYVSQEVINKLDQHRKKLITDIMVSDDALFERLVSMGIVPGENIMVINELPNVTMVKIKDKKFALDKNIARKIKVLKYEES